MISNVDFSHGNSYYFQKAGLEIGYMNTNGPLGEGTCPSYHNINHLFDFVSWARNTHRCLTGLWMWRRIKAAY